MGHVATTSGHPIYQRETIAPTTIDLMVFTLPSGHSFIRFFRLAIARVLSEVGDHGVILHSDHLAKIGK